MSRHKITNIDEVTATTKLQIVNEQLVSTKLELDRNSLAFKAYLVLMTLSDWALIRDMDTAYEIADKFIERANKHND